MSTFYELDCCDETSVIIEVDDHGEVALHDFDLDAELAAQELGFEPSLCWLVWLATKRDVEAELYDVIRDSIGDPNLDYIAALLWLVETKGLPVDKADLLYLAVRRNQPHTVRLLLEAGADLHAGGGGYRALFWARKDDQQEISRLIGDWFREHE